MSTRSYKMDYAFIEVIIMIKKIIMKNLICSNCAGKIEKSLANLDYINSASFNFPNQVMLVDATDAYDEEKAIEEIKKIVDSIEDGVLTYSYDKRHLIETVKSVESYYSVFIGIAIYIVGFIFDYYSIAWGFIPLFTIGYLFIAYRLIRKTLYKKSDRFGETHKAFLSKDLKALLKKSSALIQNGSCISGILTFMLGM